MDGRREVFFGAIDLLLAALALVVGLALIAAAL